MSAPRPAKLLPLRNGITFAFNDYDIDGKPQWLIHDAIGERIETISNAGHWLHAENPKDFFAAVINFVNS